MTRRDEGASAIEYGLLIAGVAAVIAATVFLFGGQVAGLYKQSCETLYSTNYDR